MERASQSDSTTTVRSHCPDWSNPTGDDGEELLMRQLDDVVNWSGWLAICSAEREPAFADIVWQSPGV